MANDCPSSVTVYKVMTIADCLQTVTVTENV